MTGISFAIALEENPISQQAENFHEYYCDDEGNLLSENNAKCFSRIYSWDFAKNITGGKTAKIEPQPVAGVSRYSAGLLHSTEP